MPHITAQLSGGDLRSIGSSNQVVRLVLKNPRYFKQITLGMTHENPLIRARASDAVEKITITKPAWLQPHKHFILKKAVSISQQEVRWHVAQLIPRLPLTASEKKYAFNLLLSWLTNEKEKSNIVRVFSMQGAYDMAQGNQALLKKIAPLIRKYSRSPVPSLRSRANKLLKIIKKPKK